jgi:hypothetical protein
MWGGKHIAKADVILVFASENEGGAGVLAPGIGHEATHDAPGLSQPMRTGEARPHWLRGLGWDFFWLQSALWLVPLALVLAHGYEDPGESPLDLLVFALTAVFWISHRFGSSWLAYATTAYRPVLRAEPTRFVIVPLAIAAACFAILLPADDALPFTRAERVMALAMVDFALVTYHFAAQHFGVLSLYRVHSGRGADPRMRRLDRLFALVVGGALVVLAEAVAGTTLFQDVWEGTWLDLEWLAEASGMLRVVATALVLALTLAMLASEARAPSVSLPRVLYVVGVAAMVCVGLHTDRPLLFVAVWTGQHWLAATALATRVACAEPAPPGSLLWRTLHAVNRRPWALLLVLGLLSVLLLPVMEVEANGPEGPFYGDRIFGTLAVALRTSDWVPALVALGFTTGFLHYWLDRAVYRLSRPAVRIAARGLLGGSGEADGQRKLSSKEAAGTRRLIPTPDRLA